MIAPDRPDYSRRQIERCAAPQIDSVSNQGVMPARCTTTPRTIQFILRGLGQGASSRRLLPGSIARLDPGACGGLDAMDKPQGDTGGEVEN